MRMRRLRLLMAGALTVALVACGGSVDAPAFDMAGVVTLSGGSDSFYITPSTDTCMGDFGYKDLRTGAPVTVYDAAGKILALGQIDTATRSDDRSQCVMRWSVDGVPGGQGPYQYEVTHRGKVSITEADAKAGKAAASIGTN